jgi:hypothetical protein
MGASADQNLYHSVKIYGDSRMEFVEPQISFALSGFDRDLGKNKCGDQLIYTGLF